MSRVPLGRALVAAATLLLGHLALAPTASAAAECGTGTPFVAETSGYTDYYGKDWWQTAVTGRTTFQITSTPYSEVHVYDATCGERLCYSAAAGSHSCTATTTGPVNIMVTGYYAYYTLSTVQSVSAAQCSDGLDNDLNGATDYPADAGCSSPSDAVEAGAAPACSTVGGLPVCVAVENGGVVRSVTVYGPRLTSGDNHLVVGALDLYRFPLPTGGSVTAPCVVLTVGNPAPNLCQAAGGTYVSRMATLLDETVGQPGVALDVPLATVRVCAATYTVTVAGIGVEDFPAYSVC